MSQNFLDGAVGVSKVLFVKLLEVLLINTGNYSIHGNIYDLLLYLLRLLAIVLHLLKGHDLEWGGGEIDGASR